MAKWHAVLAIVLTGLLAGSGPAALGCAPAQLATSTCTTPPAHPTATSQPSPISPSGVTPWATTHAPVTPQRTAVVINHQCTDISRIPPQWITRAKTELKVLYFHSSHGAQITVGMLNLQERYGAVYSFNESGSGGALRYREIWADLGTDGNTAWKDVTRNELDKPDDNTTVVIWSWCGGVSDNTKDGIDAYLAAMNSLENDYPRVRFVYMTGHLDGTGESGNLNMRNEQIREWCKANNKTLFDFADIESYDPDGNYYLDRGANADCRYDGGNWAEEWVSKHPESEIGGSGFYEHTHVLNCNLKGRAFWWMMARIAGWQGT